MASQEYWKNREKEAKKHNIQEEAEYNRKIKEIYANMMDEINKEINGFYTKYAAKEGITMAEAKKILQHMNGKQRNMLKQKIFPIGQMKRCGSII